MKVTFAFTDDRQYEDNYVAALANGAITQFDMEVSLGPARPTKSKLYRWEALDGAIRTLRSPVRVKMTIGTSPDLLLGGVAPTSNVFAGQSGTYAELLALWFMSRCAWVRIHHDWLGIVGEGSDTFVRVVVSSQDLPVEALQSTLVTQRVEFEIETVYPVYT